MIFAELVTSIFGLVIEIIILATLYFIPTVIAYARHKRNALPIFLLNLLLGATIVGWIAALVWACTKDLTPHEVRHG